MGTGRRSQRQQGSSYRASFARGYGIIVGVFVALLILFLWMHFIVAQENELIGREIYAQTQELARIERENMALRQQIAAMSAESMMAERADALSYRPQQPLYLLLSHPLVSTSGGSHADALLVPSIFRDAPGGGDGAAPDPAMNGESGGEGSPDAVAGRP